MKSIVLGLTVALNFCLMLIGWINIGPGAGADFAKMVLRLLAAGPFYVAVKFILEMVMPRDDHLPARLLATMIFPVLFLVSIYAWALCLNAWTGLEKRLPEEYNGRPLVEIGTKLFIILFLGSMAVRVIMLLLGLAFPPLLGTVIQYTFYVAYGITLVGLAKAISHAFRSVIG